MLSEQEKETAKLLQQLHGLLVEIEIKSKVIYHFLFYSLVLNVICCIFVILHYLLN